MSNKLVLSRPEDEILRIEVGSKEIILDPLDTEFPLRLDKVMVEIEKNADLLKQKMMLAEKKEDKERKGLFSANEHAKLVAYQEYNKKNRELIDSLLGEGICQEVFGDKNYLGMFNDLFDALMPFIEKAYEDPDALLKNIERKYKKKEDDVLK